MMERDNDSFPDESAVEEAIVDAIAGQTNLSFIIGSSQNIDRLVSAYRACIKTNKSLVIDLYTAWILEQLKLVSDSVPNMSWERMRVYFPYRQYEIVRANKECFGSFLVRALERRIKKDELWEHRNQYLYLAKLSSGPLFNIYKKAGRVKVIYSQWLGYLKEPSCRVANLQSDPQVEFIYAHTSGHAVRANLKEFADALAPKRLTPVHTEYADRFGDHFKNVVRLQDGEALEL
ncbi:MAG: hypothetical protein IT365_02790 [Candidatus Hydrogenedentes bacterium]|nr:hypothetical protein [Candidatus Hydrogenedentota bacterium]